MDVFIYTEDMKKFVTSVYLPKSIINEKEFEDYLNLGPDYLIGRITFDNIFNYIIAPLYVNLEKNDLLDNEEFRKLANYRIGLH